MQHPPTAEQTAIVDAAKTGDSVLVEAGAGAAKTTTLALVAEALSTKRIAYIAYNKKIQLEAASKFPENTDCRTAHSHAYRAIVARSFGYKNRLKSHRIGAKQVAAILGIRAPITFGEGDKAKTLSPATQARIALATVTRFCQSDSRQVEGWMVPKQDGLEDEHGKVQAHIMPYALKAWDDLKGERGSLKFDHGHYLKLWQLSDPKINAEVILFDEAQDANPVIKAIIEAQDHAQVIMVGDRAQAIYGFTGAVDAMQTFKAKHHLTLTKSFRFGPAIADNANQYLSRLGTPLRLEGFEKIASVVGVLDTAKAVLCRTNAGVIEVAMGAQANGQQAAIVGGASHIEKFADAADDLMDSRGTDHPELAAFRTWNEVQAYSEEDEGADLRAMVRLVDNYGTKALRQVARNSVNEDQADVIVSTAHKAKGCEWDTVRIHSDFAPPKNGGEPQAAELMLMYVAVTRAKLQLDALALVWVFEGGEQTL